MPDIEVLWMRFLPLACLMVLPLLAACTPEMETSLRVSDIVAVGDSGEMRIVPATLRIPQQDDAHCADNIQAIVKAYAAIMPVGAASCNGNDAPAFFADLETELAIVPADTNLAYPQVLALAVTASDEGGADQYALDFFPWRTLDELARLATGATEPLGDPIPPEVIPQITFNLVSDLPQGMIIEYDDVFVDGRPRMATEDGDEILDDRTLAIQLSDVTSAHVSGGLAYTLATIYPIDR